jgi:hypothetical protein
VFPTNNRPHRRNPKIGLFLSRRRTKHKLKKAGGLPTTDDLVVHELWSQLLFQVRHKQRLGVGFQSMCRCQRQFIGGSCTDFIA